MFNCNYYLGFNAEPSDFVYHIETKLYTEEELGDGWGYCIPMNWENAKSLEELFTYLDEEGDEGYLLDSEYLQGGTDGGVGIKSTYPKFNELISEFLSWGADFYNFTGIADAGNMSKEEFKKTEISTEEFCELLKTDSEFFVTICEMEPSC